MTRDLVEQVADTALHAGLSEATVQSLRTLFRGVHLTYCMDDDVTGASPFVRRPGINVYLVSARDGHCIALTSDLDDATGLVLAEVLDSE